MKTYATIRRINSLKEKVAAIPDGVRATDIWSHLGWTSRLDQAVEAAAQEGIALEAFFELAPDFRDIVSIVVSGTYGFPHEAAKFDWEDILNGKVREFPGKTPKERLLAVLESTHEGHFDA